MAVEDGNLTNGGGNSITSAVANSVNEQGYITATPPAKHTANAFQQIMSEPSATGDGHGGDSPALNGGPPSDRSEVQMNTETTTTNEDGHHIGDHSGWNYGPYGPLSNQNEEDDVVINNNGLVLGHDDDFPEESQGWGETLADAGWIGAGAFLGALFGGPKGAAAGAAAGTVAADSEWSTSGNRTTRFGPDQFSSVPGPHAGERGDILGGGASPTDGSAPPSGSGSGGDSEGGDSSDPTGGYGT